MSNSIDLFKFFEDKALVERALLVAEGKRHKDYKKTIDVAKWCYQINTGDDQTELVIQYRPKESDKQKERRVRVYNSRTPQVANKVKALFNEVHRSDEITDNLKFGGENEQAKELKTSLNEKLDCFDGLRSVRKYLTDRTHYFTFFDPNAWVVVEFEGDAQERKIYPFEVESENALDFNIHRGILQYFVSRIVRTFKKKDNSKIKNNKYTLYAAGINVDVIEVPEDREDLIDWVDPEGYELVTREISKIKKQFFVRTFVTKNKHCPAARMGYIQDPSTKGRTFISPLHLAEKTIQRLIWRTSTLDISHACHGFYKMMMYAEECNHKEVISGTEYSCDRGWTGPKHCDSCKGTGKRMHISDQDVVMYLLPEEGEKIEPLSNFIHYANIPTEMIQEQAKEVESALTDALSTIFNENIFDKSVLANTATGIHYNWRSVNNRLLDYGNFDADNYTFIVKTVAMIQNMDSNLTVEYGYPSDFKLESVQELLTERQTAVTSNAPTEVITNIDLKILAKQHRDNPEYVQRFKIKEQFRPLRTKRTDERIIIIERLPDFHPIRVLDQYFDEIFDDLHMKHPKFYEAPFAKQKQLVDDCIKEFIQREKAFLEITTFDEKEPAQQEEGTEDF